MTTMKRIILLFAFCVLAAAQGDRDPLVDRVGTTGFLQVEAASFQKLSPKERELAYWLSEASIAIDPIFYDQLSRFGLRQKHLLEMIVAQPAAPPKILAFTKLFWANRGNHNENTAQKFLPEFSFGELKEAARGAYHRGGSAWYGDERTLLKELDDLRPSLFDADFEPMITSKTPRGGMDIIQASSNNFYLGVTAAELAHFGEKHPLNSRVAKIDGRIEEQVYRAGTPDHRVPAGLYAEYLAKANGYLEKAAAAAESDQAKVIRDLIRYFQTGEPADWIAFGIDWVRNNARVDFANGFIEVYRDARGAKGTAQSFVSITDERLNSLMLKIGGNAQYFEDRAPWATQYKMQGVRPPLAKAVETVVETGDFHVTTVGDNLPNENEIHEKYGSKSFLFTGSSRALNRAGGTSALGEFAWTPEEAETGKKYGDEADDLLVAMHEIIGHGSGKLNPKLTHDPAYYLKQYYSTLEEARADLMALWNVWDPKLAELGLISNPDVAKAMYYSAARAALTQLRRIPKGDTIEEDHQRDRQLIVNYIIDKTGGIERKDRAGKHYIVVTDFEKMRKGVGQLLAELMRIKAEGDYDAIKALIEAYGVHFEPAVRDEVVARYKKLDLPVYWAGINPSLDATLGPRGEVKSVEISYPRDYVAQQLRYSSMYNRALAHATPPK
ncbi:MAG: dipeptidyl peptidase 3 [Acidobacteriota bacterium]|nr:dipeptidyl peptidase 3 [Acidobacteriota bacterium]